jgi:hypothetical protein
VLLLAAMVISLLLIVPFLVTSIMELSPLHFTRCAEAVCLKD